jgi:dynein heavy chain 1, cytosolic
MAAVAEVNGNGSATGPGINNHARPDSPAASTIDPQILIDHLARLLAVMLGATEDELKGHDSLLGSPRRDETMQKCARFAQESGAASLYVQKVRIGDGPSDGDESLDGEFFGFFWAMKGEILMIW